VSSASEISGKVVMTTYYYNNKFGLISTSSEVIASRNKLKNVKCENCLFQSPQCQLMLPLRESLWISSTWPYIMRN